MNKKVGPFTLYTKKPNDIKYGYLYTMEVNLPVPNCSKRTVRVYLPEDYDPSRRYPVLYMMDGQNIVDKYTSAYGAWDIDVHEHELIKEGYHSFIVVGIDCPKIGVNYRVQEYTFMDVRIKYKRADGHKGYSDIFMNYVVNELKEIIDNNFSTLKEREFTGIGGSSMGGIASFNFITTHKDIFGFALSFSPAFHIYDKNQFDQYIESLNINPIDIGKIYLYSGDREFEHSFFKPTIDMYRYLRKRGFSHEQVALSIDSSCPHNEASWSKHFNDAIKFWLNGYEIN